jgi:hypothetical protein
MSSYTLSDIQADIRGLIALITQQGETIKLMNERIQNLEKKELEKHDTPSPECKCYECKDYREWLRSSELHEDELLTEFELHAELLAKQEYKQKVTQYVDHLLAEDHEEEVVEKLLAPVKNTYEERVQERHNKFYDLWEKIANEPPDEHGDAADLWNYEYNED